MRAFSQRLPTMRRAWLFSGRSMEPEEARVAVVATVETVRTLADHEHALQLMRVYLADCAKEKEQGSIRRMEELNAVIGGCIERLASDRRDRTRVCDPALALDALSHAIRYVDEHLAANLRIDPGSRLETDAFASGHRFNRSTGIRPYQSSIRCRLRRAMNLLRDRTLSLERLTHEVGRSCHNRLTRLFGRRSAIIPVRSLPACILRSSPGLIGPENPYPAHAELRKQESQRRSLQALEYLVSGKDLNFGAVTSSRPATRSNSTSSTLGLALSDHQWDQGTVQA
jgi:hypothetical protein